MSNSLIKILINPKIVGYSDPHTGLFTCLNCTGSDLTDLIPVFDTHIDKEEDCCDICYCTF